MALHMALSILVWMAVTRRVPIWYYFAAVLLHAAANIPAALSQLGLLRSMWCIEGIILQSVRPQAFGWLSAAGTEQQKRRICRACQGIFTAQGSVFCKRY